MESQPLAARRSLTATRRRPPDQPEIALYSRFRVCRDDRHEQSAFVDLLPDLAIPHVPASQLALVEPDLDAGGAERFANLFGSLDVL